MLGDLVIGRLGAVQGVLLDLVELSLAELERGDPAIRRPPVDVPLDLGFGFDSESIDETAMLRSLRTDRRGQRETWKLF